MSTTPYPTATLRPTARLERLALALGICLPVPALAATGLSLPIPPAVERLAAALVPWAEAVQMSDRPIMRGAAGTIVLTRGEHARTAPRPLTVPSRGSTGRTSTRAGTPAAPVGRRATPDPTQATTSIPSRPAPAAGAAPDVATTVAAQEPVSTPTATPRIDPTAPPTSALPAPEPTTTTTAPPLPLPAPVAEPVATVLQPVTPVVTPIVGAVEDTATKVLPPIDVTLPQLGG